MSESISASHPVSVFSATVDSQIAGDKNLWDVFNALKQQAIDFLKSGGFNEDEIIAWLRSTWATKVVPVKWTNRPVLESLVEQAMLETLCFFVANAI
jgi:hypothetical protein